MTELNLSLRLNAEFAQAKAEVAAMRDRLRDLGLEAGQSGQRVIGAGEAIGEVAPAAALSQEELAALAGGWAGLVTTLDPAIGATMRFEEAQALVNRAIAAEVTTVEEGQAKLQLLAEKLGLADTSAEQAAASARLAETAYASLMAGIDPLEAASQRFAQVQEIVDRALTAGVISADQAGAALGRYAIKLGLAEDMGERQVQETARLAAGWTSLRASLDPAVAAEMRFAEAQALVNRAIAAGVATAAEGKAALDGLALKLGLAESAAEGAAAAQMRLHGSAGASAGAMGNLAAQWNDVVMMALAGQNPFQLAIQQGTQITQVFGGTGATGALRMLGASALSLLNPFNLLVIGGIAAGTALVQWFMSAGEEAETLRDRIDALKQSVDAYDAASERARSGPNGLAEAYGAATKEAQALAVAQREVARLEAERATATSARALSGAFGDVSPADARDGSVASNQLALNSAARVADVLGVDLDENVVKVRALMAGLNGLASATGPDVQARALAQVRQQLIDAAGGVEKMNDETFELYVMLTDAEQAALRVAAATRSDGARAQEELAAKKEQAEVNALILQYGEDSAQVAARRLETEREVYAAWVDSLEIAAPLKEEMMAAWDAAEGIASSQMAAAIEAALGPASRLGELLKSAAGWWEGVRTGLAAQAAIDTFNRDSEASSKVYSGRGEDPRRFTGPASPSANTFGGTLYTPPSGSAGGGGAGGSGGAGRGDTVASLRTEARELMTELDRDIATIQEKLRAGVIDQAEATDAVRQAKDRAANRLAELIPQLAAMGEGGAAAVDEWRQQLDGLAGDLKDTGTDLSDVLTEGFKSPFKEFVKGTADGQEAMDAFTDHVLDRLADIAAEQLQMGILEPVVSGLFSGFGGFGGLGGGAGVTLEAKGDVFQSGRIVPFADGGAPAAPLSAWLNQVVSQPTLFPMIDGGVGLMGEAGQEAIMPVGDGGVLAVIGGRETRLPLTRGADGRLGVAVPDEARAQQEPPAGPVKARPPVPFADGGAPAAPLSAWLNQVVSKPTLFPMIDGGVGLMGEAGQEAIMPVGDGGVLAVIGGRETRLPLTRGADGRLGVAVPDEARAQQEPPAGPVKARPPVPFADGGAPAAPLSAWLNQVVSKPTLFPMIDGGVGLMGEAGQEAIMPVGDGGVLAVIGGRETRLPLTRGADGRLGVAVPDDADPRRAIAERFGISLDSPDAWRPAALDRAPVPFAKGGVIADGDAQDVARVRGAAAVQSGAAAAGGGAFAMPAPVVNLGVKVEGVPAGHTAQVQQTGSGSDLDLRIVIEQVSAAMAQDVQAGRGPLPASIEHSYGLPRVPR